jgi:hypothetical protein
MISLIHEMKKVQLRAGGMAQMVKHVPSKQKPLGEIMMHISRLLKG